MKKDFFRNEWNKSKRPYKVGLSKTKYLDHLDCATQYFKDYEKIVYESMRYSGTYCEDISDTDISDYAKYVKRDNYNYEENF